jgi:hypothetical protein
VDKLLLLWIDPGWFIDFSLAGFLFLSAKEVMGRRWRLHLMTKTVQQAGCIRWKIPSFAMLTQFVKTCFSFVLNIHGFRLVIITGINHIT